MWFKGINSDPKGIRDPSGGFFSLQHTAVLHKILYEMQSPIPQLIAEEVPMALAPSCPHPHTQAVLCLEALQALQTHSPCWHPVSALQSTQTALQHL